MSNLKKKCILIVEDDPYSMLLLKEYLSELPFDIETADNGTDALEKYSKTRADIVLTDIKMAGIRGIELCSKIKKINPLSIVIAQTACVDKETLNQLANGNFDNYLIKPYLKEEVLNTVKKTLQHKSSVYKIHLDSK